MIKNQSNFKKHNPAQSLIASKPFPFASYLTFPLWHVYAITPIALWLIPPANAFRHSIQSKKVYDINLDNSKTFGAVVPDNI